MPELTTEQLIASCHEFVLQQQELDFEEPKPEPEWTGSLTISPAMVADILLSNNEE
jgi:hypothetical protein